ncbi:MAG: carbohydrate binding family 9 domain-containing protein, partial [Gemmatimonadota bacterium]|nr:carbohydrate binding family 9 domain-containing protein [Gemmatimonadota bacterium]
MLSATALLLLQAATGNQATPNPAAAADSALVHAGGRVPSVVVAVRAENPPSLDGDLDDEVWQAADPVTGFRRDVPSDGLPASERTEVRVAYTNTDLYVGARMYDRTPSRISRLRGRRDSFGQQNDQFLVQIDSYHDHRTAFIFGVTPAGGRNDVIAPNDGLEGLDTGWDPVWEVATRVDSLGWVAEIRIPFSQLRFPQGDHQIWGINFRRDILHAGEAADWNWTPGSEAGWTSQFGHLVGLEGIPRPGRLEILPYVVAQSAFDQRADPGSPFDDGSLFDGSMGVDLKYGLTSGLTLDGTINPDFGQVEADPAVINLSAFETFFPEQRPFFVEDARVFDFSLSGRQNQLFYTRRIGRAPHGGAPGDTDFAEVPENATILG